MQSHPLPEGPALDLVEIGDRVDAYVELELLASAPYAEFVYGDLVIAKAIHRRLVEASAGEFAAPFGRLAVDGAGNVIGALVGPVLTTDLAKARFRAATALHKDTEFRANPEFRERMTAARAALLAPLEGDAYLSRFAVAAGARGRGLGKSLLARFLADSVNAGARRAVLEVSPIHGEAIRLYHRAGFETVAEQSASHGSRTLTYLHLVRDLTNH